MKPTKTITVTVLLFIGAFFLSFSARAQHIKGNGNIQSQSRPVTNFNAIDCAGTFDVYLQQGTQNALKVSADENLLPYIITEVKGNTLELRFKRDVNVQPSKHIAVYVTTSNLEAFSISGVCKLQSENTLQSDNLKLSVSGVADMHLQMHVNTLKTNISGTAKMLLQGKASSINFHISGKGDITADDLVSDNADVHISGMGKIHVNVQKQLEASISGMGDIRYKGNPALNESVSGMGKVMKE